MTQPTKETIRADKAANMYFAEAEYLKSKAAYAREIGDTKAEMEAKYQAELAERTAEMKRDEADREREAAERKRDQEALTEALRAKVREYMLIADIPSVAMDIPADTTFADLAEATDKEADKRGISHYEAAEWVADEFDERYLGDSDARSTIERAIKTLLERADRLQDGPLTGYIGA